MDEVVLWAAIHEVPAVQVGYCVKVYGCNAVTVVNSAIF